MPRPAGAPKSSSGGNPVPRPSAEALLVMALTAGGTLAFYAYTTYMQKFLVNTSASTARRRRGS
jgi:MHS family alpha-ketoglutarate permease-like MFS transporter